MRERKYKLVRSGKRQVNQTDWKPRRFYQLVALRDIPLHNVKAGDRGGYVSNRWILSHEGDCWIGEEAQVIGHTKVTGDAYVGGKALVFTMLAFDLIIKDNARIHGDSSVWINPDSGSNSSPSITIGGSCEIHGNAEVMNTKEISGFAKIHGNAYLDNVSIVNGEVEISGHTTIEEGTKVFGNSRIFGEKTLIGSGSIIRDCIVSNASLPKYTEFTNRLIDGERNEPRVNGNELTSMATGVKAINASTTKALSKDSRILAVYNEVRESINSFETDIVKIIKYPVMTDKTDPLTRAMARCLKDAEHYSSEPDSADFAEAVRALEDAYFAAESNALKIAATSLSVEERKKIDKAKDLLAMAANEATSENEKKLSFKQAFKSLEGVVVVPDVAVDTFRVKIGLKELEM